MRIEYGQMHRGMYEDVPYSSKYTLATQVVTHGYGKHCIDKVIT